MDLLKVIRSTDAHLFQSEKTETLYYELLTSFLSKIPPAVFDSTKKPSPKTLKDRFKLFWLQHRSNNTENSNASGNAEHHGQKVIFFWNLIQIMDSKDEESMGAKLRQTEIEKLLENAGEFIRISALKFPFSPHKTLVSRRNPKEW